MTTVRPRTTPSAARRRWAAWSSSSPRSSATSSPSSPPTPSPSASALLLLFLFCGLGLIGFIDDYIKVSKQRNLGLRSKAKFIGQIVVGLIFASLAIGWEDDTGRTPITHAISFTRDLQGVGAPDGAAGHLGAADDRRRQQRREPHRRTRRPRHGCCRDDLRCLRRHQHLAEQPELLIQTPASSATRYEIRSTSRSSRRRSPAPASASCGGTRRRPRSSWATPVRCHSAARWPASR